MGFVAKSAFWLGLVYSAMPFDSGKPNALAPGYPLGTYASVLRQHADDWRSAIEVAASLSAPAKQRSNNAPTLKERAAPGRRLSPEKSD
jgi:hypothetical protein